MMSKLFSALALALLAVPAFASPDLTVPEPGSLALVGLAVAIGVAVTLRKKK